MCEVRIVTQAAVEGGAEFRTGGGVILEIRDPEFEVASTLAVFPGEAAFVVRVLVRGGGVSDVYIGSGVLQLASVSFHVRMLLSGGRRRLVFVVVVRFLVPRLCLGTG